MKPLIYCRFGNIQQTLRDNCILYLYSKNGDKLKEQETFLKNYCKIWSLTPSKIYKDFGKNTLDNKHNLKKLLLENQNKDILVINNTRLSRNYDDMFYIADICEENNLRIFSTRENEFLFDEYFNVIRKIQNKILDDEL